MQNSYLAKGDKVLSKGDGGTIWTVESAIPQSRDRLVISHGGYIERRAYGSLRKLSKAELVIVNAYNDILDS